MLLLSFWRFPGQTPLVEIALVMVPVTAVVVAVLAWRIIWGQGKKRQYVLSRERRKWVAYGLFALAAIVVGAVLTMMQPGNPALAFGFIAAAAQINALFEGLQPEGAVAATKSTT